MASQQAEITDFGDGYSVTWPAQNVVVAVDYLQQQTAGLLGEMTIRHESKLLCESLRCNLNSEPKTKNIARKVYEYHPLIPLPDWARLIEQSCIAVLRRYRRGEPPVLLTRHSPVEHLTYAISPLLLSKKTTICFGDGGLGKSTLGLFCCMLASVGGDVAGLSAVKGRALYLDWEDDASVHARRLQALQRGHPDLGAAEVLYQKCALPLFRTANQVVRQIKEEGITLVVVDSLMAATGGDATAEGTSKLFAALRLLDSAVLAIGHVAKNQPEGQGKNTVFGSIFFQNFSRSIWELKKEQEIGEDSATLALIHRKSNLSRLHMPIGLTVRQSADNDSIQYETFDLSQSAGLEAALPLPSRIRNLLDSDGIPRSANQIAEALNVRLATVQSTLSRKRGTKWSMIGENREAKWTTLSS